MLGLRDTLKLRLSVYISLSILFVGVLASFSIIYGHWKDKENKFLYHAPDVLGELSLNASDQLIRRDNITLFKSIEAKIKSDAGSEAPVEFIEVLNRDGSIAASVEAGISPESGAVRNQHRIPALNARREETWVTRLNNGGRFIDSTLPLVIDGVRIGTMRAGLSDTSIRHYMKNAVKGAIGFVMAACVLGIVIGGRIAGWVSRPINALVKGAEEFSKGNLEYRLLVRSPKELEVLSKSMGDMAMNLKDKIESLDGAKKEFESVSKELSRAYRQSKLNAERLQETNEWVTDMAFRLEETNKFLQAEKKQTETIINSIRDGLVALDRDNRIIMLNPEAEDIFDAKLSQVKDLPVQVLLDRLLDKVEDPEALIKKYREALASPQTDSSLTIVMIKPFRKVLKRMSSVIRDENGGLAGRIVILRDITREKEVDDMKSNFISTVSHELRTPLTSIKGALNLLMEGGLDEPEMSKEFLKIADQNTDRLVSLITNLLDLSRIEEGGVKAVLKAMRLDTAVAAALNATEILAKQAGVSLDWKNESGSLEILGDSEKIEQVAVNLISNAVKFSEPGGRVTVTTKEAESDVKLEIEDQGEGIPKDKLSRIFEKFYQVDMSATRKRGGTGLGLAISQAIVNEHGGRIWAESPVTPDKKGSRFIVLLPKMKTRSEGPEMNGETAAIGSAEPN
ncbi:MAG: ATP-binding protein, partial [Nitrospirota bacterium]